MSSQVLSDEDKRKDYDLFGDVDGLHVEFESFFQEHFVDLLTNIFDFPTFKGSTKPRRPKAPGKAARSMKQQTDQFDQLLMKMMDLGIEDSEEDRPLGKRNQTKKPPTDDEWEDVEEGEEVPKNGKEQAKEDEWEDQD